MEAAKDEIDKPSKLLLRMKTEIGNSPICLLCKTTEGRLINCIDTTNEAILLRKKMFATIVGETVSEYVQDYHRICLPCTNILSLVEDFIEQLRRIILEHSNAVTLPKLYAIITGSQLSHHTSNRDMEDRYSMNSSASLTLTNNLLTPCKSIVVNADDTNFNYEARKYQKYKTGNPDDEVMDIMTRSRKRKKPRGTHFTHRKRASSTATYTSIESRTSSRVSTRRSRSAPKLKSDGESISSFFSIYSRLSEEELNIRPRTRCKSRYLEMKNEEYSLNDLISFKCEEPGCDKKYDCDDTGRYKVNNALDDLTKHLVNDHNKLALFHCKECKTKYTTQQHLERHEDTHFDHDMICPFCQLRCDSLKDGKLHIDQHWKYYVPCNYCDLQFLEATALEEHIKKEHKEKRKRVRRVKAKIQYRISKDSEDFHTDNHTDDDETSSNFRQRKRRRRRSSSTKLYHYNYYRSNTSKERCKTPIEQQPKQDQEQVKIFTSIVFSEKDSAKESVALQDNSYEELEKSDDEIQTQSEIAGRFIDDDDDDNDDDEENDFDRTVTPSFSKVENNSAPTQTLFQDVDIKLGMLCSVNLIDFRKGNDSVSAMLNNDTTS